VTLCFCRGIWRRRSWFSLKGKVGFQGQSKDKPLTSAHLAPPQAASVQHAGWKRNHSVPGVQSRFHYSRGWSARIWMPARMMNIMKNMFRKCCARSHHGKPESTDGAAWAMPG
jgi:hypothetical protein